MFGPQSLADARLHGARPSLFTRPPPRVLGLVAMPPASQIGAPPHLLRIVPLAADIAEALNRMHSERDMLQSCTEALVRHLDAAFARIWTLDHTGQTLALQASAGLYTRIDGKYRRVRVGELKIGAIAAHRRAHLTNDVPNDPRIGDPEWARRERMVAFAGYPLLVGPRLPTPSPSASSASGRRRRCARARSACAS
jgi:hypothetical protein